MEKTVLVLMAPGFEEIELSAPVDILRRLGIKVVLAGVQGRRVEGAHGMVMEADMLLVDVEPSDYAGIILPGGMASWVLRDTPAVLRLVREMNAQKKLVAAICAAPIALAAAGVLEGKCVACYPAQPVLDDLGMASVSEAATETDANIVTGRGPGAALEFGFALGNYLGKKEEVKGLRKEMCVD